MHNYGITIAVATLAICTISASADQLSKQAVKFTAAEANAMYAGKSSNWSKARAYFAPDGTFWIIGKDKSWYGEGRWTVNDNKVCSSSLQWTSVKDGKTGKGDGDCWTWYKDGKRSMMYWSGDKLTKDAYSDGEVKKLSMGDKVTADIQKLKQKSAN